MGLLKHFRSRSRLNNQQPQSPSRSPHASPIHSYRGRDQTQRLPDNILESIFEYTCPHTLDHTYEPSERSQIGDGCMLCDLRDLASCAQVCRKWYAIAQRQLYTSIRIDAVHYCWLEEELAERRKKAAGKHFRSKSNVVEPGEVPNIRLSLLCRTVRENERLADQVLLLKVPYMTRETAKGELARTVSALPNLQYVDLPDGFFNGDPSCLALRHELQARCPEIRKMSYRPGSEEALELLAQRHWQSIEQLELSGLHIEPATLRIVLASLPTLHELTLSDLPWLDDTIFQPFPGQLPDFPPLQVLKLENTPNVTAHGLTDHLELPQNREVLSSLSLTNTGVTVQDLHLVLWSASQLIHLAINETVSKSLTLTGSQLPPLTSICLKTLNFEITSSEDIIGLQKPAESYYAYLANSLHSNALPALKTLYVRDTDFPELLTLPPMPPPFGASPGSDRNTLNSKSSNLSSLSNSMASTHLAPHQSPSPIPRTRPAMNVPSTASGINPTPSPGLGTFNQTLEVFSKGLDELEWVFTSITPAAPFPGGGSSFSSASHRRGSSTGGRPLSAISASKGLGPQWAQGGFGGEARKSVMVGNGFGGFLAVPQEEVPRPLTSDGNGGGSGGGRTRWGSFGSSHGGSPSGGLGGGGGGGEGAGGSRLSSFLKPPPSLGNSPMAGGGGHERRGSRHDLWR
ncbi:hypothetical protein KC331_g1291 [Hortaea werneckii]|uniref:F-box domain-containing protein n=1 Tax=Hortaea werneckii TaxID=91943 RepID=A0A3M7BIC8_HORWE|nr:hypothetical protein KC331_g1291 [Hortaea werneckii]KAI7721182.1 hypothetical protein KC353_g1568 [Hortaea werneckii]RMY39582.1 hypothetical protein D0865_12776 [Hortaea werneckii]